MDACRRKRGIFNRTLQDLGSREAYTGHKRCALHVRFHSQGLRTKSCRQVHGVDYEETYAPVVKFTSVRVMLARAAVNYLELHQMDVVIAFLQGDIDKNIYVEVPSGFKDPSRSDIVCKLR